jgi:hypothetical protein
MPKQTDITGSFRVPEEAWGRFWNLMRTIDGAEILPAVRVNGHAKPETKTRVRGKDTEGSSGKCIVLNALLAHGATMTTKMISDAMVAAGRSPHVGSLLDRLKKDKVVVAAAGGGYRITAAGRKFAQEHCTL